MTTREKVDDLYSEIKQFYLDTSRGEFRAKHVTMLTKRAMQIIQTGRDWSSLSGPEKKEIVISVIQEVVSDLINDKDVVKIDDNARLAIDMALETLPFFIDAAADFAKVVKKQLQDGIPPHDNSSPDNVPVDPKDKKKTGGCFCF